MLVFFAFSFFERKLGFSAILSLGTRLWRILTRNQRIMAKSSLGEAENKHICSRDSVLSKTY